MIVGELGYWVVSCVYFFFFLLFIILLTKGSFFYFMKYLEFYIWTTIFVYHANTYYEKQKQLTVMKCIQV